MDPFYLIETPEGEPAHLFNQKDRDGFVLVYMLNSRGEQTKRTKRVYLKKIKIHGRKD